MLYLAAALLPLLPTCASDERPNLLILLLDDVGIDQLACYDDQNGYTDPNGYPYAHLPNVDALAARGVRFDQCRTMPVCSPSRASILSGLYPFRHGVGRSVYVEHASERFRELGTAPAPAVTILPQVLSAAGYRTAVIGKWHLALERDEGGTLDTHPLDLGFDAWRGPPRNLMDPGSPEESDGVPRGYHNYWWVEDGERAHVVGPHATQHTAERAADWIGSAPEPWFAYVPFNACHAPLDAGNWPAGGHGFGAEPDLEWRNTRYRATLEHLDTWLGPLLAAAGEDTLVVLLGDNGTRGPTFRPRADEPRYPEGHPRHRPGDEAAPFSAAPYDPQRAKQTVYDAAVRVPLIVAGPGVAAPGRASDALVDTVDLLPTLAALAGAKAPEALDGFDLSVLLRDPAAAPPRTWSFAEYFYPNGVDPDARTEVRRAYVRRDGAQLWKLIHEVSYKVEPPAERRALFLVSDDPLERRELPRTHPEFKETNRAYKALVGAR
jgi:arylsulfatase A-like enzyme